MNTDTTTRVDDTDSMTRPEDAATTTRPENTDNMVRPEHADSMTRPEHNGSTAKPEQLFREEETQGYRSRWEGIQAQFVDSPREAVEKADQLVEEITQRLTDLFSEERRGLEEQWSKGDGQASTEDLRMALTRYRTFFQRLLAA